MWCVELVAASCEFGVLVVALCKHTCTVHALNYRHALLQPTELTNPTVAWSELFVYGMNGGMCSCWKQIEDHDGVVCIMELILWH